MQLLLLLFLLLLLQLIMDFFNKGSSEGSMYIYSSCDTIIVKAAGMICISANSRQMLLLRLL